MVWFDQQVSEEMFAGTGVVPQGPAAGANIAKQPLGSSTNVYYSSNSPATYTQASSIAG